MYALVAQRKSNGLLSRRSEVRILSGVPLLKAYKMPYIKITDCSECGDCQISQDYTSDSFERCEKWLCKKDNKYIVRYKDWYEKKPTVPVWCPRARRSKNGKNKKS